MHTVPSPSPLRFTSSLINVVPQPLRLQAVPTATGVSISSSSVIRGVAGLGRLSKVGFEEYASVPAVDEVIFRLVLGVGLGVSTAGASSVWYPRVHPYANEKNDQYSDRRHRLAGAYLNRHKLIKGQNRFVHIRAA